MKKYNNIAIIAFICSICCVCCIRIPFVNMLLPPVAVILSIIAKRHEEQLSKQRRLFLKAAMIIGTIVLFVVSFSITMALLYGLLSEGIACAISMVAAIILTILSACLYNSAPKRTVNTSMQYDYEGHLTITVYTSGVKIPGKLYEEVPIESIDGEWYYSTASMTDRFNSGGSRGKVPNECIINGEVDTHELLRFIALTHPYMKTMDVYR